MSSTANRHNYETLTIDDIYYEWDYRICFPCDGDTQQMIITLEEDVE